MKKISVIDIKTGEEAASLSEKIVRGIIIGVHCKELGEEQELIIPIDHTKYKIEVL